MRNNPHFLKLTVPAFMLGGIFLTSCVYQPPTAGQARDPLVFDSPRPSGQGLNLDDYLKEPMRMKRAVEDVARRFKANYANDSAVMSEATNRYQTSAQSLRELRDSIKRDLVQNTGTSEATRTALDDYERTGNDFRFYYDEVADTGRYGSAIGIGASLITELIRLYSNPNQAQANPSEITSGVDARLTPAAWESLY
jgi:hypothetical protein